MKPIAKDKIVRIGIIFIFVALYLLVSLISTLHSIEFFALSNPSRAMSITLAVAFEIGAAASLASLIILHKMNKFLVWSLFLVLTSMQAMSNAYFAYVNLSDYQGWIELFNLVDLEIISQKRILAIISGAILPLVALGFIKSLVDYIKPDEYIDDHTPRYKSKEDETDKEVIQINEEIDNEPETRDVEDNKNIIIEEIKEPVKDLFESTIEEIKEPVKDEIIVPEKKKQVQKKKAKKVKVEVEVKQEKEPEIDPEKVIIRDPILIREDKDKPEKVKIKKTNGVITEPYDKILKTIEEKSNLINSDSSEEVLNAELEAQLNMIKNDKGEIDRELLKNIYGEDIPKILKHYFNTMDKKNKK